MRKIPSAWKLVLKITITVSVTVTFALTINYIDDVFIDKEGDTKVDYHITAHFYEDGVLMDQVSDTIRGFRDTLELKTDTTKVIEKRGKKWVFWWPTQVDSI